MSSIPEPTQQEKFMKWYINLLKDAVSKNELLKINSNYIFNICGSYCRGKKDCGDIDVLITINDPTYDNINHCLHGYINILTDKGILIDHLTEKGDKKYMGFCKLNGIVRRIDIRYIDYQSYYPALIYFTGSKEFNIKVRNKALEKGYSLSEYGLKEKSSGKLITLDSEEELFKLLNIPYQLPIDR